MGSWLLTMYEWTGNVSWDDDELIVGLICFRISHWDHERERIVILTRKTIWIVKYDFIAMRILEKEKHELNKFDTIQRGPLTYPASSIVP